MGKIAVFTDENSKICDFFDASRFLIWEKSGEIWAITSEINFTKITPTTPAQTRKDMATIAGLVGDCKIIAGGILSGIPYTFFDQGGMHIFQVHEQTNEVFDSIIEDVEAAAQETKTEKELEPTIHKPPMPIETKPGIFTFNLLALQSANPGISSKKALQPFLQNTAFDELILMCKHIPPWIAGAYNTQVISDDGGAVLCKITPI